MSNYLNFYYTINDPQFKSFTENVKNNIPNNTTINVYISTPIYDVYGVEIGYKRSSNIIQELNPNEYMITVNTTYYINNVGSVNIQTMYLNNKPSNIYTTGETYTGTLVLETGNYFAKTGVSSTTANADGTRYVTIGFNF